MGHIAFSEIQCMFMLEMLTAAFLFMLASKKRKHFPLRFLLTGLSAIVSSMFITEDIWKFVLETMIVVLVVYICCEISWKQALHVAVCSYALQHLTYVLLMSGECIKGVLIHTPPTAMHSPNLTVGGLALHIVVYLGCYFLFIRKKRSGTEYDGKWVAGFSVGVFLVVLGFSHIVQTYIGTEEYVTLLICYMYSVFSCVLIIVIDEVIYRNFVIQNEMKMVQYLWQKRKEQYGVAKENVNVINRKCHELKRQISKMQENGVPDEFDEKLEELKNSIQIYDAVVKTGSEVVDVVLADKSLYCQANQITLACVVDGVQMEFMEAMDVYSLFISGMDSAIAGAMKQTDPQKRQIAVAVWRNGDFMMIQIENYCGDGELLTDGKKEPNLDEFGRKSMEYIVKKYEGCMTVHQENSLFIRRILIPVPEKDMAADKRNSGLPTRRGKENTN